MRNTLDALHAEFALTPIVAAELECYVTLTDTLPETMDSFWRPVSEAFVQAGLNGLRIEKERGTHQYEVITPVMGAPALVQALETMRRGIEDAAAQQAVPASFAAKPFANEPSSGLHIHLHLADAQGINAYHKTEEWTSDVLRWSLGGLLEKLPEQMPVFFPNAEDYARLNDTDHVPKIYGWGVNNRYCALRIPADPDPYHKRIEHRVPCANADPESCIGVMLEAVLHGLRERIEPPAQEYGKVGRAFASLRSSP